jgi:DNA repair exonuclease SbcCD ATPase subunit/DNA repair exonuclease SbcCD nuclease subunit
MKFAHIADTHIRNLKYHKEYKEVFNKIYESLKKERVDYIVHCGDICHTKTQISPEYVSMASDFLSNLADIAPTYVILGNHDGNLRNGNRQDSITPIVDALDHKNLHLLKNSGEKQICDKFTLNVLSVFDTDNWVKPSNKNAVNIALYHGSVSGCITDLGWKMEHGEHDISIFKDFDYAMLGDIHLENQILDEDGRVRYAGSTIQQNFGESINKGYLLWNIKDKINFYCKSVLFTNPKPFVSIPLTEDGKVPTDLDYPQGSRVRLVIQNSISTNALKKAVDVAKKIYKPESVSVINRSSGTDGVEVSEDFKREDLRDIGVQEKLIREYLKDYSINEELDKKIVSLNKKYNEIAEQNDETYRNTNYEILNLEWDNLFNYGEGNKLDLTRYNGITGIFGKNFSGKSSIVDSLLFTIYNSISKNSRKSLNIVNNDKEEGYGKVEIRRGDKTYTILRRVEKYLKKLKGKETIEARTYLDFSCVDINTGEVESLNGTTRADTDRNIVKYFGTFDDFLVTSMSSQMGALNFISEGSTKRKEILAKFLDLDLLEKKFKTAKEDAAGLKAELKVLGNVDHESELKKLDKEKLNNEALTEARKNQCSRLKTKMETHQLLVNELEQKIKSAPTKIVDIEEVHDNIEGCKTHITNLEHEIEIKSDSIIKNREKIEKANKFINSFDVNSLTSQKGDHDKVTKELNEILRQINDDERRLDRLNNQVSLLMEVPCGDEFSSCKFIRGAYEAKDKIDLVQLSTRNNKKIRNALRKRKEEFQIDNINEDIRKFEQFLDIKGKLESSLNSDNLILENTKSRKSIAEHELKEFESEKEFYEKNKEVIENINEIISDKNIKQKEFNEHKQELEQCENIVLDLYKSHGYFEQKIENLKAQKEQKEQKLNEFEAYDLYMRCMHPNGIAYDIIKKSLPVINSEISKVLANVVDFEVFFETEDNRLDIYIKHPNRDPSPLEMASGAEKTVSAMAVRLAFISVSTIPRSQLFILDEPGTALDEERMEGFTRILDIVKSVFKTVILISHLDNLKDAADSIIGIEKKNGYANVNC